MDSTAEMEDRMMWDLAWGLTVIGREAFLAMSLASILVVSACGGGRDLPPAPDVHTDQPTDGTLDGDVPDDWPTDGSTGERLWLRLVDLQQVGSNILVFVSVTTESGVAVTTLTPDDFWVEEDGEPLSIEASMSIEKRPPSFVWKTLVVIDTSYSVLSSHDLTDVVDPIHTFASDIIAGNTQAEEISIAAFDGAAAFRPVIRSRGPTPEEDDLWFTALANKLDTDIAEFTAAQCTVNDDCLCEPQPDCVTERPECVAGLCVDRSTNLYGAVIDGIVEIESRISAEERSGVPRGGTLAVFTDGSDQAARRTLADVQSRIGGTNVFVFAVAVEGELDEEVLATIGRDGTVLIGSIDGLDSAMDMVAEYKENVGNGLYLISYCTPTRSGSHQIGIGIEGQTWVNSRLTRSFTAKDEALCDPEAASTACEDLVCGAGGTQLMYCGDCAGGEICLDGTSCDLLCTPGTCGQLVLTEDDSLFECGGCPSGQACVLNVCT